MTEVRWDLYPLVRQNETAQAWLRIQGNLQLAPKTIDAYGRSLNDFLAFCERHKIVPEDVTREYITLYVNDLATRPNPKGANILHLESGAGLANSTMQLRITVVRLFCEYLVEMQIRPDTPVGRGHYVPGKGFGGARDRGLLPRYQKLPWIPSDQDWLNVLQALKEERSRNRVMLLLAYDGALRREELVTLQIGDIDFAYRQISIRPEQAKNGSSRVVGYSKATSKHFEIYLHHRRKLSSQRGPLFLSESRRNYAQPLSLVMWSKIVERIADRCHLPQLTTHTMRHLRLTHLARAHMELHQIATYAGHRSLETTMQYIHLSGVELTEAVSRSLARFESWIERMLGEP